MRLSHEAIKEKLPEYIREKTMPDDVKAHLQTCSECSQEASILRTFLSDPVPEPGDMFFETLPQRVRASLQEKKRNVFLRLAPVFAVIVVVVITGYIYNLTKTPEVDEVSFSDPFAPQVYDLSGLSTDDIPSIAETIEDNDIYLPEETSFIREFASLSSEELEDLYDVLKIKMNSEHIPRSKLRG